MTKIRTNFIELLLKEVLTGKVMYDNDGNEIIIDDINYQPMIQEVYIKSGNNGYKMSMELNYDFELTDPETRKRINANKGKIKGKYKDK